jgi:hypothetical protein
MTDKARKPFAMRGGYKAALGQKLTFSEIA